ncbi:phage tail tape measure protein [Sporosarcina sp. FSL W7-1283]|uniref:phage tail tape measure protein n=1 Tax=Sporosarcina sp. FSL W7-1283 TaxID=2921560 RepID=UPI0030F5BCF2
MKNIIKQYSKVVSSISEMSTEEAEKLLATVISDFELTKEVEVGDLINSLNELSNKNAVTVDQLLLALSKASSLASSEDISPEKVALYAACSANITRETGGIIGNALKSFLSRMSNVAEAKEALKEVGIEDFSKTNKVVDELVEKWKILDAKKKRDVAVKVAGRFNMARFMILFDQLSKA